MIGEKNMLYNTFTCLGFSEELQQSMNELIVYMLDLMLSGLYPEGYQIMMKSYYETKMVSLASVENVQDIRIQMLFVLYGAKLLHEGNRERFLEVANQFASNKLFDASYYKNILLQ